MSNRGSGTARYIFFGYNRNEAAGAKRLASLLPATAFAFGADIVADYEYAEQGVQEWNAGEGSYSFNACIGYLIFDTFFYLALAWYLDQVVPREFGSPQPVWFLCKPTFWWQCCSSTYSSIVGRGRSGWSRLPTNASASQIEDDETLFSAQFSSSGTSFRPSHEAGGEGEQNQQCAAEPSVLLASTASETSADSDYEPIMDRSLIPRVVVRDLYKVYGNMRRKKAVVPAVNHLDLTLYESQITTLLGHNGTYHPSCT